MTDLATAVRRGTLCVAACMASAATVMGCDRSAVSPPPGSTLTIQATNAFYYYTDVERAWTFYTEVLGFETVTDYGFKILRVAPASYLTLVDAERGMHSADEPKSVTFAIVTEQVEGWYEYLIAEGVPMRAELSLTDGRPHDGFVAIDPEGYYLEFERFNSHGENQALMPVLEEIEPLGGVTVSFFTDDVDAWFTRAQGVGLELRTPEVTSESERVRVFVGYDPEGYFLEWDTFLPVGANARLLGVLDRSAP